MSINMHEQGPSYEFFNEYVFLPSHFLASIYNWPTSGEEFKEPSILPPHSRPSSEI